MGSTETGELFTQAQYDAMPEEKREKLKVVGLTPEESVKLEAMNRQERRDWMRANKKFSKSRLQRENQRNNAKVAPNN